MLGRLTPHSLQPDLSLTIRLINLEMAFRSPDTFHCLEPIESHLRCSIDHLTPVGRKGFLPGELLSPKGVASDSISGHIYIAEGCRVSIFSEAGGFLGTLEQEHMKVPWGIAVHCNNMYITDISTHSVLNFPLSGDFRLLARLGGRGSGVGQFDAPRQLAVSAGGHIFVADRNNHRIQVLDSGVSYKRHFSHHSMTHPCDVKLAPNEVFVLSDSDASCVHVFSHAGDKLRSLEVRVRTPSFFDMDDGTLFLSDCLGGEVRMFSKSGALLNTLGGRGHGVGMFSQPRGVALTRNSKLVVVSQNENYGLQIFSLSL